MNHIGFQGSLDFFFLRICQAVWMKLGRSMSQVFGFFTYTHVRGLKNPREQMQPHRSLCKTHTSTQSLILSAHYFTLSLFLLPYYYSLLPIVRPTARKQYLFLSALYCFSPMQPLHTNTRYLFAHLL